jgi:ABC-type antimicrobial peptide transport system permease subunit
LLPVPAETKIPRFARNDNREPRRFAALTRLVMRQAVVPIIGGILAGLVLASGATRSIGNLLYETKAGDPAVMIASTALLLAAAFVAALLPARRAASVDPMQALRNE